MLINVFPLGNSTEKHYRYNRKLVIFSIETYVVQDILYENDGLILLIEWQNWTLPENYSTDISCRKNKWLLKMRKRLVFTDKKQLFNWLLLTKVFLVVRTRTLILTYGKFTHYDSMKKDHYYALKNHCPHYP